MRTGREGICTPLKVLVLFGFRNKTTFSLIAEPTPNNLASQMALAWVQMIVTSAESFGVPLLG